MSNKSTVPHPVFNVWCDNCARRGKFIPFQEWIGWTHDADTARAILQYFAPPLEVGNKVVVAYQDHWNRAHLHNRGVRSAAALLEDKTYVILEIMEDQAILHGVSYSVPLEDLRLAD